MLSDPGGPGLAGLGSESAIHAKAARRFKFAELQHRAPIMMTRIGLSVASDSEKTSNLNKYLPSRYYSAMEAHEDNSLLSPGPIKAAADSDRSEPTTMTILVAKVS